jgi:hypothetical protein
MNVSVRGEWNNFSFLRVTVPWPLFWSQKSSFLSLPMHMISSWIFEGSNRDASGIYI